MARAAASPSRNPTRAANRRRSAGPARSRKTAAEPGSATSRRQRDPEGMQRRILQAATGEFAAHGFGGARVERISRRAGTVDRMLYYYFGSKESLFRRVLEGGYERLGEAEQQLNLTGTSPLKGMRELIAFTWNHYLAHPEFIRLLNSENLHQGQHLKDSTTVAGLSFPLLNILGDLLLRGAKEKAFRRNVDPVHLYITIAALAYFYLSNRYTLSRFLGRDLLSAKNRKAWLAHITQVVIDHIRLR